MDEGALVADVDGVDVVGARSGDAIAADPVHRLIGLAFVHHRRGCQAVPGDVVEPHLIVLGVRELLDQVEVVPVIAQGVELEVTAEVNLSEAMGKRAVADQEAAGCALQVENLPGQGQPATVGGDPIDGSEPIQVRQEES